MLMRVAGNDHIKAGRDRVELQFLEIMQNVDTTSAEPYQLGVGIARRPVASIDVSSDRSDRRYPSQSHNDVWPSDIASVDDVRDAGESLLNLWAQKPVGIRDDSNPEHCASVAQHVPRLANKKGWARHVVLPLTP
jgi:hypothetical protein